MMCRLIVATAATVLTACTATGSLGNGAGRVDWLSYASMIQSLPPLQLESEYQEVMREHETAPTTAAKIKLALLISAPQSGRLDLPRATRILDEARSDPAAGTRDVEFATFLQTVVTRIEGQQTALAEESAIRQSLERQLAALKALETRLNADESAR